MIFLEFFPAALALGFAIKTKNLTLTTNRNGLSFTKKAWTHLEINRSGHYFSEYYSATILKKILTFTDPGYVDLRSAGIGIGGIVYNYDGKIFASDEGRMLAEMGDTTEIGNLDDHNYTQVIGSEKLLDPLVESVALAPLLPFLCFPELLRRRARISLCNRW